MYYNYLDVNSPISLHTDVSDWNSGLSRIPFKTFENIMSFILFLSKIAFFSSNLLILSIWYNDFFKPIAKPSLMLYELGIYNVPFLSF